MSRGGILSPEENSGCVEFKYLIWLLLLFQQQGGTLSCLVDGRGIAVHEWYDQFTHVLRRRVAALRYRPVRAVRGDSVHLGE